MTSQQPNPRRRNLDGNGSATPRRSLFTRFFKEDNTSTDASGPLRKSSTFHSPTTPPAQDEDPILNIPRIPKRSPTCPKSLEDAVAAGERRIANLLSTVDRSLSGLDGFSTDSQDTLTPAEDYPVPRFLLDAHITGTERMDVDMQDEAALDEDLTPAEPRSRYVRKHHRSDSGIGSSVTDPEEHMLIDGKGRGFTMIVVWYLMDTDTGIAPAMTAGEVRSGINGSTAANPRTGAQQALSEYACRQIQKHIISPIVNESSLKDFHPLVQGIPYRVNRKEITCLRDLEKVLLWLAPVSHSRCSWERRLAHGVPGVKKWSITAKSFLNFCETSIQCIHTTVEYLNESDQRRPTDLPYTNGYFLDLTEQVRQYAAMINASRERMAAGRGSTEDEAMMYDSSLSKGGPLLTNLSDERLGLHGGLTRNGRPAELVRIKNGKSISLRTGSTIKQEDSPTMSSKEFKRHASEEMDDDFLRSMGRRKKGAPPPTDIHHCRDCEKVFKRPCDLTYELPLLPFISSLTTGNSKHEKTHSRPWKCSDSSCKYYEYGWPTEKERDRHMNDKHSSAPSMFKCQFRPCPYESKRESNCKQHMEKAHGWAYVRSKNNGKNKRPSNPRVPQSPQIKTPGSTIFDAASPDFGSVSPYTSRQSISHGSVAASEESAPFSVIDTPFNELEHTFGSFNTNLWNNGSSNGLATADPSPYTPSTHSLSWGDSSMGNVNTEPSFETSLPPVENSIFADNFDWSNMDTNFTSYNIQLVTPATSIDTHSVDAYSRNHSISLEHPSSNELPSLSPCGHGNAMLYSPYSQNDNSIDEGYDDFAPEAGKPCNDFALFDHSDHTLGVTATGDMFQDLSSVGPSAWSGRGTDLAQQLGVDDLMQE